MIPLARLSVERARALSGVLFDLDDTLLSHGVLTSAAYAALWAMADAGLRLVAVTGRPSGWGEVLVRQWPIAGAVTENGAIFVLRDGVSVDVYDPCSSEERRARRTRLAELVEEVARRVPEARLADDVGARRSDVTWDIGERERLPRERADVIAGMVVEAGARTTRSSVHLHATFDADDKASGAVAFLARVFGEDRGASLHRYGFIGDSGNDAACFAAFTTTFGVANVAASLDRLVVSPRFVTRRPMGDGFVELADALVAARGR